MAGDDQDHPRSRGVYCLLKVFLLPLPGSSPLARGLPSAESPPCRKAGIIPARAGSTEAPRYTCPHLQDHPRSRGVYDIRPDEQFLLEGSSPLARGLLKDTRAGLTRRGIIPARAGSTLGDPWNPNDHSPYQTASAFTADLAPARRRCGSAAVERRSTMTPSEA